jgi:hypothetical protein
MPRSKNTHATHIEDSIFEDGSEGGKQAIKFLRYLGSYLSGTGGTSLRITTKFDGAPAIVCGIDPSDGQFFVATKSAFAKSPKLVKSENDATELYDGQLSQKLQESYRYLSQLGIKDVIQGDLMFTNDKREEVINNQRFITFRPNTITYAVDPNSELGRKVNNAKLGIVFHTKYTGTSLQEMSSSFDIDLRDLKQTPDVWFQTADFNDLTGIAGMNRQEKQKFDSAVNLAEGSLKQCSSFMDQYMRPIEGNNLAEMSKTFFNQYVKRGESIPSVKQSMEDLVKFISAEMYKKIDKVKTESTKDKYREQLSKILRFLYANERELYFLLASYQNLQIAKNIVIGKLKKVSDMGTFIEKNGGYDITYPEGFMAIDDTWAVKLVDRLEFSLNNFSVPKTWDK